MSSWRLWKSPCGRVSADWNKQAPYSVFVLHSVNEQGIASGETTHYKSEAGAVRAARRIARSLPPLAAPIVERECFTPLLRGLEGKQVEVIDAKGREPRRFWVGKCEDGNYLELKTAKAYGGVPANKYYSIRIIERGQRLAVDKWEYRTLSANNFFNWLDATREAALASPMAQMLKAHNPKWAVSHTGGGCLCWELILGGGCWIWICDEGSSLPESIDTPCLVGLYDDEDNFLQTDALNLADAINEASHYIAMGRPPAGSNG